jgi:hypothetical protein
MRPVDTNKTPPPLICMSCCDPYWSLRLIHGYLTIFNFKKFTVHAEFSVDIVMMGQLFWQSCVFPCNCYHSNAPYSFCSSSLHAIQSEQYRVNKTIHSLSLSLSFSPSVPIYLSLSQECLRPGAPTSGRFQMARQHGSGLGLKTENLHNIRVGQALNCTMAIRKSPNLGRTANQLLTVNVSLFQGNFILYQEIRRLKLISLTY